MQAEKGTRSDKHTDTNREVVVGFIIENVLEFTAHVVEENFTHVVDADQVGQALGIEPNMVELHILCEILLQNSCLTLQTGMIRQTQHHISDLVSRILHVLISQEYNFFHSLMITINFSPQISRFVSLQKYPICIQQSGLDLWIYLTPEKPNLHGIWPLDNFSQEPNLHGRRCLDNFSHSRRTQSAWKEMSG